MSLFIKLRPLASVKTSVNILNSNSRKLSTTSTALFLNSRLRRIGSGNKENIFKQKDNVPSSYELIYLAPLENYVTAANYVSTATAGFISLLASYKYASGFNYFPMEELDLGGLVAHDSDIWFYAAGFIAINAAIRVFVAKYPLRIYKSPDNYIAVYDPQLPFMSSQHTFERGAVSEVKNIFNPWAHSMYWLGKRTSLLLIDYFKTPSEFHQMCALK